MIFNVLNTKKKFKTFMFKTVFSIKKSIITIILKTRIIIITFMKFITSIIFIKIKVDDAKKLIYYNYN